MGNKMLKNMVTTLLGAVLSAAVVLTAAFPVSALEDGTYTVERTVSYANPETGQTVDGGTNIALGDSMAQSIVDTTVQIEQTGGKIYVTVGLGLMSNISSVTFTLQQEDGSYAEVPYEIVGSCTRLDDLCNHYRFEMTDLNALISPIIYVDPMGRDVQFLIRLDTSAVDLGSDSQDGADSAGQTDSADDTVPDTSESTETQTAAQQLEEAEGLSRASDNEEGDTAGNAGFPAWGSAVIAVAVLAAAGVVYVVLRRRK